MKGVNTCVCVKAKSKSGQNIIDMYYVLDK